MIISISTDLLKASLVCVSKEQTRYWLCGVFIGTSGHMVTTDGHRMFVARLAERPAVDVIVPYDAVAAALKMAGSKAKEIELDLEAKRLGAVTFQPIDGTFPDWQRVIPCPAPGTRLAATHFNPRYVGDMAKIGDALVGVPADGVTFHPTDAGAPCLVTFGGRADCFAALMPLPHPANGLDHAINVRNAVVG